MLLQSDIRKILKLGKKILLTFFLASFSISLGFIISFAIFHNLFDSNSWKAFGAFEWFMAWRDWKYGSNSRGH